MQKSLLESTRNTRELGGHPTQSGTKTAYLRFWRSDKPTALTEKDLQTLLENGITTMVDLRNNTEIKNYPHSLQNAEGFTYCHCPMYGNNEIPREGHLVPQSYFSMVTGGPKSLCAIMRALASAEGGVMFNCAEGKDRTGAITALLLLLAGVPANVIVEDYHLSKANLQDLIEAWAADPDFKYAIEVMIPEREYMAGFLEIFCKNYPNVETFLLEIGLSDGEIATLKAKLTEQ